MNNMEWNFDEHRWDILIKMHQLSEFIDYMQMDVVSVYPIKELMDNYGNVINLIITISEKDVETFNDTFKKYDDKAITNAIDVLLECAIDNDVPAITASLLDYKYRHNLFDKDKKDWRL